MPVHLAVFTVGFRKIDVMVGACFRESAYEAEFQHLLRGREGMVEHTHLPEVKGLKPPQAEAMMRLTKLPAFKALAKAVQNNPVGHWTQWTHAPGSVLCGGSLRVYSICPLRGVMLFVTERADNGIS